MKKFNKTIFALVMVLGLAACGKTPTSSSSTTTSDGTSVEPTMHTVSFWKNTKGGFIKDVEVEHGKTVAKPADPVWEGYVFDNWFTDKEYTAQYDFATPVNADLDLYANWKVEFVQDPSQYHLIGDFKDTKYEGTWNVNLVDTILVDKNLEDEKNTFSIDIELGQYAQFKVKDMATGTAWDDGVYWGTEYVDFTVEGTADIIKADDPETDKENITILTAGTYHIELDTSFVQGKSVLADAKIRITRTGPAVGAGVTQDADPNAIKEWGLIGSFTNNWTDDVFFTHDLAGTEYKLANVVLLAGEEFKIRANSDFGFSHGWGAVKLDAAAPAGALVPAEFEEDGVTGKPGGNIKVGVTSIYSFKITFDAESNPVLDVYAVTNVEPEYGLAGSFNGWSSDAHALTKGTPTTEGDVSTIVYEYASVALEANAEFKVKAMNTWEISYGDGANNYKVTEAGTYKVTFTLVVNESAYPTRSVVGTISLTKLA